MDLFIIGRKNGKANIIKEYIGKAKDEARGLVKYYLANYEGYICSCPNKDEAIKICKELNGN